MLSTDTSSLANEPEWNRWLSSHGAIFEGSRVLHFGRPEQERGAAARSDVIADLSHLALWRVEGADAQAFLQGQLSNDVRKVDATHSQLSAYCSSKGRMLAIFRIFQRGNTYFLQLPLELSEPTLKRLRMFVLRSKVRIEPVGAEFARIGISGPHAEDLVRACLGVVPGSVDACLSAAQATVIRLPGPLPRFELVAPAADMPAIWQTLSEAAQPVGSDPWEWLDIAAGIPVVHTGTVEEFVPQMANLELVGGVSFTKGCYPGQEIVARMHYLGRLKQRMYRAHVSSDSRPQPGDRLFAVSVGDQSIGQVVDAQPAPDGGFDVLAVLQIDRAESSDVRLGDAQGPKLALGGLPYSLAQAV
jgi:hypothetical protein